MDLGDVGNWWDTLWQVSTNTLCVACGIFSALQRCEGICVYFIYLCLSQIQAGCRAGFRSSYTYKWKQDPTKPAADLHTKLEVGESKGKVQF